MVFAFLIFIVTSFVGGSINPVLVKLVTETFPPITTAFIRLAGATLLFLPLWLKNKEFIPIRDWIKLAPFGISMGIFTVGIQFTTITMNSILYTLLPIITAVLAYLILKEKLSKFHILGFIISFIGVAILLYASVDNSQQIYLGTPFGNGLILLAVIAWAFYTIGSRSLSGSYSLVTIIFYSAFISTILMVILLPVDMYIEPISISKITFSSIVEIVGLILIASGLFQILYQWLVKNTSAFFSSLTSYGSVAFSAISGALVFGEKFTIELFFGALLVLVGVFLSTTYKHVHKHIKRIRKRATIAS